jgi:hypothetical protein
VSFRSLLYEDFDQVSPASIAGSINVSARASSEPEGRLSREIEIVRREGFEAGRTQGVAEGRQAALKEAEVRLARDLPDLLANLGGASADMGRAKLASERDAFLLASAALRQMLPIVAERGLGQEAAALVAEVVADVPAPVIEVHASPRTREAIERWCGQLPPGVALVTNGDVPEGGVRCAWAHGQAHFDGAAATEAVLAILDRCIDRMDRAPATSLPIEQAPPQNED